MAEVKLTPAQEYAIRYADHLVSYIGPCPWNPFPRNSPWGRMIDEAYRRNQALSRHDRSGE